MAGFVGVLTPRIVTASPGWAVNANWVELCALRSVLQTNFPFCKD